MANPNPLGPTPLPPMENPDPARHPSHPIPPNPDTNKQGIGD